MRGCTSWFIRGWELVHDGVPRKSLKVGYTAAIMVFQVNNRNQAKNGNERMRNTSKSQAFVTKQVDENFVGAAIPRVLANAAPMIVVAALARTRVCQRFVRAAPLS